MYASMYTYNTYICPYAPISTGHGEHFQRPGAGRRMGLLRRVQPHQHRGRFIIIYIRRLFICVIIFSYISSELFFISTLVTYTSLHHTHVCSYIYTYHSYTILLGSLGGVRPAARHPERPADRQAHLRHRYRRGHAHQACGGLRYLWVLYHDESGLCGQDGVARYVLLYMIINIYMRYVFVRIHGLFCNICIYIHLCMPLIITLYTHAIHRQPQGPISAGDHDRARFLADMRDHALLRGKSSSIRVRIMTTYGYTLSNIL